MNVGFQEEIRKIRDFFLISSLKKHAFYNLLINNILYLCHLILGDTKGILTMFVRKKKYPSGNIGVIGQRRFFVS